MKSIKLVLDVVLYRQACQSKHVLPTLYMCIAFDNTNVTLQASGTLNLTDKDNFAFI